jgi:uncharacterized membrane protein YjjB (DUF3815 family)
MIHGYTSDIAETIRKLNAPINLLFHAAGTFINAPRFNRTSKLVCKMLMANRRNTASDAHALALLTPTSFGKKQSQEIAAALNALTADVFAIYLKTKISVCTVPALILEITILCWMNRPVRFLPERMF